MRGAAGAGVSTPLCARTRRKRRRPTKDLAVQGVEEKKHQGRRWPRKLPLEYLTQFLGAPNGGRVQEYAKEKKRPLN